jgi:hypothetical protein
MTFNDMTSKRKTWPSRVAMRYVVERNFPGRDSRTKQRLAQDLALWAGHLGRAQVSTRDRERNFSRTELSEEADYQRKT